VINFWFKFAATTIVAFLSAMPLAQAATCAVTDFFLGVGGLPPVTTGTISNGGCTETASNSSGLNSGSTTIDMSDGVVKSLLQVTSSSVDRTAGNVTTNVAATLPSSFLGLAQWGGTGTVGGINYNLSSVSLLLSGNATVMVSNPGQALDANVTYDIATNISDVFSQSILGKQTFTLKQLGIGTTGSGNPEGFFGCNTPTQCSNFTTPVGQNITFTNLTTGNNINGIDFSLQLFGSFELSTQTPGDSATLNAKDPFQINSMELLDANGQVIPGVTFIADDGFVFPSPMTAPVPKLPSWAAIVFVLVFVFADRFAAHRGNRPNIADVP
jgi:hypothetical protein